MFGDYTPYPPLSPLPLFCPRVVLLCSVLKLEWVETMQRTNAAFNRDLMWVSVVVVVPQYYIYYQDQREGDREKPGGRTQRHQPGTTTDNEPKNSPPARGSEWETSSPQVSLPQGSPPLIIISPIEPQPLLLLLHSLPPVTRNIIRVFGRSFVRGRHTRLNSTPPSWRTE